MPIYQAIYDGPARSRGGRTSKRYIVMHCTQNDASASGEASYAKRRTDGVSSHYYCDDSQIVQSLDTDLRAQHVGSRQGNDAGISYEVTGFISWDRDRWLRDVAWDLLVAAVARDCAHHDIEPRELTVAEIEAGDRSGIITHDQARQAWGGTTHTDPGEHWPMDHLVRQVRAAMEDDVSAQDVWDHAIDDPIGEGRHKRADTMLGWAFHRSRSINSGVSELLELVRELAAGHELTAEQIEAAAKRGAEAALDPTELGEAIAAHLRDVPPEQVQAAVEAGVREVLGGLDEA